MLGLLVLGPLPFLALRVVLAPFRFAFAAALRLAGVIASPIRIL